MKLLNVIPILLSISHSVFATVPFLPSSSRSISYSGSSRSVIQNEYNDLPFISSRRTKALILNCRGGSRYDDYDDDEYDQYDEEDYDDNDIDDDRYNRRGSTPPSSRNHQRSRPPPVVRHQRQHNNGQRNPNRGGRRPEPPNGRQRRQQQSPPPQQRRRQRQRRQTPQQSTSSKLIKTTTDIAHKSLNLATTATISTLKNSGKAAYYLTAPKYVQKHEIYGIWRFDQCIGSSACAANIEFTNKGDTITRYSSVDSDSGKQQEYETITGYLFRSRSWPRSCYIEFEAEAFQGSDENDRPVRYYYKGYFRRKMADKSVIKIVGKIYEVKKRFWQGKNSGGPGIAGEEVGSFVARKRMKVVDHQLDGEYDDYEDDFEDDEEYDDDYDEDFDDYDEDFDDESDN